MFNNKAQTELVPVCIKCGIGDAKVLGMCKSCYSKHNYIQNKTRVHDRYIKNKDLKSAYNKKYAKENKESIRKQASEYRDRNRNIINRQKMEHYHSTKVLTGHTNRECTCFLGVHVAERVLSHVFKNVKRMPHNNPNYDFICNKGLKIDVKSSVTHTKQQKTRMRKWWCFSIDKNTVADYFLCTAFDNRDDLNPLYLWLIPSEAISMKVLISISDTTLYKWDSYRMNIEKVVDCCETLK